MENLENVIEAILFVSGDAVMVSDICAKFELKEPDVKKAISKLQEKYDGKSGIKLLYFNNKLQLSSNPDYVDQITAVLNPIRQRNLTKTTLETAGIIAYKQPITRMEIEEIRGFNSDYAINILLEHKLIEVVGHKDTVGKPALFGTTDEFLKRFDISSINELPDYNELMEKLNEIKERYNENLFGKVDIPEKKEEDLNKKLSEISKTQEENKTDEIL